MKPVRELTVEDIRAMSMAEYALVRRELLEWVRELGEGVVEDGERLRLRRELEEALREDGDPQGV